MKVIAFAICRKKLYDFNAVTSSIANFSVSTNTDFQCFLLAGYGSFSVSLKMYNTSDFNATVHSYPAVIPLGDRVYLEARVGTNDTSIVALIEKCSASPTTNKNHPSSHEIIKERSVAYL